MNYQKDNTLKNKSSDYYTNKRLEMFNYIPKSAKKILDVGCGEGVFAEYLKKQLNAEVWGIELDEKSSESAKSKIDHILVGDVNELIINLPENYFDCIVFNDVLEHLSDPNAILKSFQTKLNLHGEIIISVPNIRFFPVLFDLFFRKKWKYSTSGVLDYTHLRFYTASTIKDMLLMSDYSLIKLDGRLPSSSSLKLFGFNVVINIFSLLTFGLFSDTKYVGWICTASLNNNKKSN